MQTLNRPSKTVPPCSAACLASQAATTSQGDGAGWFSDPWRGACTQWALKKYALRIPGKVG